jgi:hypothetical protein
MYPATESPATARRMRSLRESRCIVPKAACHGETGIASQSACCSGCRGFLTFTEDRRAVGEITDGTSR